MTDEREAKRRDERKAERPRGKDDDAKPRAKDDAKPRAKDEDAERPRAKDKDDAKPRAKDKDEEKPRAKDRDEPRAKDEEKPRAKDKDDARPRAKDDARPRAKEDEAERKRRPAPADDDADEDESSGDEDDDGAAAAATALAGGAPRKRTVEELIGLLRGRPRTLADGTIFVHDKLLKAIARRGERAIGPVLELLADKRHVIRYAACAALQRLALRNDGELPFALPRLVERLDDESPQVRGKAVEALAAIRTQRPEVEAALGKALGDANADVSRLAVMHTVELSTDPKKTTERMIELLTTKRSVYPRVGALMVLFHLGKSAKEALPHLVEAISDPSPEVREYANLALMGIRTPSMRLQIIRTASMRLKAVDEPATKSESADSTGSNEDVGSEDETEPLGPSPKRKLRRRRRRLG